MLPQYGTVMKRGVLYYRTRIKDANGKLVAIYAKTPEELYNKETLALEQIENATFHRKTPTVAEYCEKWLLMTAVFDLNSHFESRFPSPLSALVKDAARLLRYSLTDNASPIWHSYEKRCPIL